MTFSPQNFILFSSIYLPIFFLSHYAFLRSLWFWPEQYTVLNLGSVYVHVVCQVRHMNLMWVKIVAEQLRMEPLRHVCDAYNKSR